MKATIHDFDVGPTEEEEAIAKAWVEQDPAVEMESFDVREKLATAAAYGFAAGRAACSRDHDPRPVLLHEATEKLNAAHAELLEVRALVGEEDGETLGETVARQLGDAYLRGEEDLAHIASMLHDHGAETDGGILEAVTKLLDVQSALVAAGKRHGVEEDDPEEVARILADQLEAVVGERDDAQAQLEESERDVARLKAERDHVVGMAAERDCKVSSPEEALAAAYQGLDAVVRLESKRSADLAAAERRAKFLSDELSAISDALAHAFDPETRAPAKMTDMIAQLGERAALADELRAHVKTTVEAAGAAAADAQRTIEGLQTELETLTSDRDRLRVRVGEMQRLLRGATRAASTLAESILWSVANNTEEDET